MVTGQAQTQEERASLQPAQVASSQQVATTHQPPTRPVLDVAAYRAKHSSTPATSTPLSTPHNTGQNLGQSGPTM